MKKTLVTILVVVVLVAALGVAGFFGFNWYRDNHVFVDGDAYPIDSKSLDLTGEDISIAYYEELQKKLPDCEITWMVPFHGGKYVNTTENLLVSSLTLEDVELLVKYFPSLKTLDASECDQYDVLAVAEASLPDCEVTYEVDLGCVSIDHNAAALITGFSEENNFETLLANLVYLPNLNTLTLQNPELSVEQIQQLKAAYENVEIRCIVELLGSEYDQLTETLDLSAMTSADVEAFLQKLPLLPNLTYVDLMGESGVSQLTKTDVKQLQDAAPNVVFNYTFDFYGVTISTADEEVHIKNTKIGDEGEQEIRQALDIMTNCSRFVLEYCQVSNEVMAQIRDDYRDQTKVVWRVNFGGGSALTDVEVIRCTYDLVDDNCANLKYCEDVRFMDVGHNEWLDACEFVAGMPKLEGIIISGAPIKDLTPFENCKNLKFLEVAFCEYIEDLSPLASCENLRMLNISNTHALDLTPLDNLPLTHMCARTNPSGKSRVPADEQARFIAQHPDCWTSYEGAQPYGVGWRYDHDELTPLPYYAMLRQVFKYDEAIIPNNVGWYLTEENKATIAALEPVVEAVEETVPEETVSETVETTEPAAE